VSPSPVLVLVPGLLALTALAGACRAPARAAADPGAAIDRAWDAHIEAARRDDLAGVLAMYADDALTLMEGAEPVRGRAAIEQAEREALERADVGDDVRHVRHELRLAGDAAFELGTVAGTMTPHGGEPVHVVYDFMATWRRTPGGGWRLACLAGRTASR
jgi:uncharacterized protein (TIGR02246 family)